MTIGTVCLVSALETQFFDAVDSSKLGEKSFFNLHFVFLCVCAFSFCPKLTFFFFLFFEEAVVPSLIALATLALTAVVGALLHVRVRAPLNPNF